MRRSEPHTRPIYFLNRSQMAPAKAMHNFFLQQRVKPVFPATTGQIGRMHSFTSPMIPALLYPFSICSQAWHRPYWKHFDKKYLSTVITFSRRFLSDPAILQKNLRIKTKILKNRQTTSLSFFQDSMPGRLLPGQGVCPVHFARLNTCGSLPLICGLV